MEKKQIKTKKPLFSIEYDGELEQNIKGGEHAKLLAESLKGLEVSKGHIKLRANKFSLKEAGLTFGNAKAILKREEYPGEFKAKSHKDENMSFKYMVIIRTK